MTHNNQDEPIRFRFKFHFDGGEEKVFTVTIDSKTLQLIVPEMATVPEWTLLQYQKCVNCPLPDTVKRCPIAVNISRSIEEFKNYTSYEKTWIVVETAERTYGLETTIQNGLSSLFGIFMVTSGCPIMDNLRPMVRFHLPFATTMETTFRTVSMFLMAQYFRSKRGLPADWSLEKLDELYGEVAKVNKGMWGRLSKASAFDANANALIMLNTFGDSLRLSIKKELEEFIPYFEKYLRDGPAEKSGI
jgi:hypothetical protein